MSGPITVSYSFSTGAVGVAAAPLGAVLLAAEAIREAQAMGQEYEEALGKVQARAAELAEKRQQQQDAQLRHRAAVEAEVAGLEGRLERLRGIASALIQRQPEQAATLVPHDVKRPGAEDFAALLEFAGALREEIRRMEGVLAASGAAFGEQLQGAITAALEAKPQPSVADVLHAYAIQRSLQPGLNPEQTEAFRQTVARVLGRLELAPGVPFPRQLETLAKEIMLASSAERADALANELRLRVQRHLEETKALKAEAEEMKALLAELPEGAPAELRSALEQAAAGVRRLDPALKSAAKELLEAARQARQKLEQEAAALVLEQSLKDLGYEVEGIESTLFVEGGVAHFQRQGWEDYHVRLRLDPREKTLNFNVVRSKGMEESAERKRLDFLAEDRWCAEFPKLLQTLAARGIDLKVLRQLEAGQLPVQTVDPATLPRRRAEEERARSGQAPLQRGFD